MLDIPMAPGRHFVLVVDHDPHRGRALLSKLRSAGCYVSWAVSGGDALQYIVENEPDAVVAEWALPDMSGPELARRIKTARFATKVILEKDGVDWRDLREAFEAAADDLLPLPPAVPPLLVSLERPDSWTTRPRRTSGSRLALTS